MKEAKSEGINFQRGIKIHDSPETHPWQIETYQASHDDKKFHGVILYNNGFVVEGKHPEIVFMQAKNTHTQNNDPVAFLTPVQPVIRFGRSNGEVKPITVLIPKVKPGQKYK